MPPLAGSMSQDCRHHPFEVVNGWCDCFWKILPTSSEVSAICHWLLMFLGDQKSVLTSPLSDGSVVGGPGCVLPRITAANPSGPDVKVLGFLSEHAAIRLCMPQNWKVGVLPFVIRLLKAQVSQWPQCPWPMKLRNVLLTSHTMDEYRLNHRHSRPRRQWSPRRTLVRAHILTDLEPDYRGAVQARERSLVRSKHVPVATGQLGKHQQAFMPVRCCRCAVLLSAGNIQSLAPWGVSRYFQLMLH